MVPDANILIRAALGPRTLTIIRKYAAQVELAAPDTTFVEASEKTPEILERRRLPIAPSMEVLDALRSSVRAIDRETYAPFETVARQRIERRDADNWPVVAPALALRCPIWTEDSDFFGCAVATWTTDRVELYLAAAALH